MTPMSPPLLSLCIPTYNRSALLREALGAILAQWQEDLTDTQRGDLEVVISDNHSPDDTASVVEHIREAYPRLRLTSVRVPENRGADANILNALRLGQGQYLYLLSDDDILLPKALAHIFALIHKHPEVGVFSLNTRSFVSDPSEETRPNFKLKQDLLLNGRDECLRFLTSWITFMSVFVFRRELITGSYESRVGSLLLPAYVSLDVLAGSSSMVVTHQPFLAVRGDNTGGFNFFEVFVTRFHALMVHAESLGFSHQATRDVMQRHLRIFLTPFIAMFRVRDVYGTFNPDFRDAARRLLTVYGPQPFLLFVLLPLLFVPRGLLRSLHLGVKWGRGIRKSGRLRLHYKRPDVATHS